VVEDSLIVLLAIDDAGAMGHKARKKVSIGKFPFVIKRMKDANVLKKDRILIPFLEHHARPHTE
jgi:hypothetical protein